MSQNTSKCGTCIFHIHRLLFFKQRNWVPILIYIFTKWLCKVPCFAVWKSQISQHMMMTAQEASRHCRLMPNVEQELIQLYNPRVLPLDRLSNTN